MATAYNLREKLDQAARAALQELSDPGTGGTVSLANKDLVVLRLVGAGARTLQAAAQAPVGTRVVVFSDTDGATVNSVVVDDGAAVEFLVVQNAAGANAWVSRSVSPFVLTTETIPASPSNQDLADALLSLVGDLESAGLVDATGFTQA